jgi:hypothetical protein
MSIPSIVRVKISSEAAGAISLSQVVVQDMRLEELVSAIVSSTGKDAARVRLVLERGTLIAGASRLRWDRIDVSDDDIHGLLASFPDPDPDRPFNPARCERFVLHSGTERIPLDTSAAARKRLFRSRSFWDEVIDISGDVTYEDYSYKEAADVYKTVLDTDRRRRLREAARLVSHSSIARQLEAAKVDTIEFFVKR